MKCAWDLGIRGTWAAGAVGRHQCHGKQDILPVTSTTPASRFGRISDKHMLRKAVIDNPSARCRYTASADDSGGSGARRNGGIGGVRVAGKQAPGENNTGRQ